MTSTRCYIDFAAGDRAKYDQELARYSALEKWLQESGEKYGLPSRLNELDDTARETLVAMYEAETKVSTSPCSCRRDRADTDDGADRLDGIVLLASNFAPPPSTICHDSDRSARLEKDDCELYRSPNRLETAQEQTKSESSAAICWRESVSNRGRICRPDRRRDTSGWKWRRVDLYAQFHCELPQALFLFDENGPPQMVARSTTRRKA